MLRFLFFGLIPLMLIFAAPVFQLILSIKALKGKTKLNLLWVSFIDLILGVLLPVGATFISIYGLPPGTKCATGSVGLVLGGWMITAMTVPIIGIVMSALYHFKHKSGLS